MADQSTTVILEVQNELIVKVKDYEKSELEENGTATTADIVSSHESRVDAQDVSFEASSFCQEENEDKFKDADQSTSMLERTLDSVPGVDNQEIYESTGIVITKDASFEVEEPKRGFEDEPGRPKLPFTKETSNEVYSSETPVYTCSGDERKPSTAALSGSSDVYHTAASFIVEEKEQTRPISPQQGKTHRIHIRFKNDILCLCHNLEVRNDLILARVQQKIVENKNASEKAMVEQKLARVNEVKEKLDYDDIEDEIDDTSEMVQKTESSKIDDNSDENNRTVNDINASQDKSIVKPSEIEHTDSNMANNLTIIDNLSRSENVGNVSIAVKMANNVEENDVGLEREMESSFDNHSCVTGVYDVSKNGPALENEKSVGQILVNKADLEREMDSSFDTKGYVETAVSVYEAPEQSDLNSMTLETPRENYAEPLSTLHLRQCDQEQPEAIPTPRSDQTLAETYNRKSLCGTESANVLPENLSSMEYLQMVPNNASSLDCSDHFESSFVEVSPSFDRYTHCTSQSAVNSDNTYDNSALQSFEPEALTSPRSMHKPSFPKKNVARVSATENYCSQCQPSPLPEDREECYCEQSLTTAENADNFDERSEAELKMSMVSSCVDLIGQSECSEIEQSLSVVETAMESFDTEQPVVRSVNTSEAAQEIKSDDLRSVESNLNQSEVEFEDSGVNRDKSVEMTSVSGYMDTLNTSGGVRNQQFLMATNTPNVSKSIPSSLMSQLNYPASSMESFHPSSIEDSDGLKNMWNDGQLIQTPAVDRTAVSETKAANDLQIIDDDESVPSHTDSLHQKTMAFEEVLTSRERTNDMKAHVIDPNEVSELRAESGEEGQDVNAESSVPSIRETFYGDVPSNVGTDVDNCEAQKLEYNLSSKSEVIQYGKESRSHPLTDGKAADLSTISHSNPENLEDEMLTIEQTFMSFNPNQAAEQTYEFSQDEHGDDFQGNNRNDLISISTESSYANKVQTPESGEYIDEVTPIDKNREQTDISGKINKDVEQYESNERATQSIVSCSLGQELADVAIMESKSWEVFDENEPIMNPSNLPDVGENQSFEYPNEIYIDDADKANNRAQFKQDEQSCLPLFEKRSLNLPILMENSHENPYSLTLQESSVDNESGSELIKGAHAFSEKSYSGSSEAFEKESEVVPYALETPRSQKRIEKLEEKFVHNETPKYQADSVVLEQGCHELTEKQSEAYPFTPGSETRFPGTGRSRCDDVAGQGQVGSHKSLNDTKRPIPNVLSNSSVLLSRPSESVVRDDNTTSRLLNESFLVDLSDKSNAKAKEIGDHGQADSALSNFTTAEPESNFSLLDLNQHQPLQEEESTSGIDSPNQRRSSNLRGSAREGMLIYMTPQESMAEEEYGGHLDQSLDSFRNYELQTPTTDYEESRCIMTSAEDLSSSLDSFRGQIPQSSQSNYLAKQTAQTIDSQLESCKNPLLMQSVPSDNRLDETRSVQSRDQAPEPFLSWEQRRLGSREPDFRGIPELGYSVYQDPKQVRARESQRLLDGRTRDSFNSLSYATCGREAFPETEYETAIEGNSQLLAPEPIPIPSEVSSRSLDLTQLGDIDQSLMKTTVLPSLSSFPTSEDSCSIVDALLDEHGIQEHEVEFLSAIPSTSMPSKDFSVENSSSATNTVGTGTSTNSGQFCFTTTDRSTYEPISFVSGKTDRRSNETPGKSTFSASAHFMPSNMDDVSSWDQQAAALMSHEKLKHRQDSEMTPKPQSQETSAFSDATVSIAELLRRRSGITTSSINEIPRQGVVPRDWDYNSDLAERQRNQSDTIGSSNDRTKNILTSSGTRGSAPSSGKLSLDYFKSKFGWQPKDIKKDAIIESNEQLAENDALTNQKNQSPEPQTSFQKVAGPFESKDDILLLNDQPRRMRYANGVDDVPQLNSTSFASAQDFETAMEGSSDLKSGSLSISNPDTLLPVSNSKRHPTDDSYITAMEFLESRNQDNKSGNSGTDFYSEQYDDFPIVQNDGGDLGEPNESSHHESSNTPGGYVTPMEGLYEYYSEDSENRIRTDKVPHSEKTTHATQGVDQSEDDYASQTSSDGFSDSESYNNIAPRSNSLRRLLASKVDLDPNSVQEFHSAKRELKIPPQGYELTSPTFSCSYDTNERDSHERARQTRVGSKLREGNSSLKTSTLPMNQNLTDDNVISSTDRATGAEQDDNSVYVDSVDYHRGDLRDIRRQSRLPAGDHPTSCSLAMSGLCLDPSSEMSNYENGIDANYDDNDGVYCDHFCSMHEPVDRQDQNSINASYGRPIRRAEMGDCGCEIFPEDLGYYDDGSFYYSRDEGSYGDVGFQSSREINSSSMSASHSINCPLHCNRYDDDVCSTSVLSVTDSICYDPSCPNYNPNYNYPDCMPDERGGTCFYCSSCCSDPECCADTVSPGTREPPIQHRRRMRYPTEHLYPRGSYSFSTTSTDFDYAIANTSHEGHLVESRDNSSAINTERSNCSRCGLEFDTSQSPLLSHRSNRSTARKTYPVIEPNNPNLNRRGSKRHASSNSKQKMHQHSAKTKRIGVVRRSLESSEMHSSDIVPFDASFEGQQVPENRNEHEIELNNKKPRFKLFSWGK
ncbi:uncharacterized protein LOC142350910 isoform X3 [Convolutriloba macropyga]|uniref:uncharacterized protein LOC142350910 isoform X3 n=1 Tax=Convolutriloba macropyga TaxID=536237 RepID=UPI003F52071C